MRAPTIAALAVIGLVALSQAHAADTPSPAQPQPAPMVPDQFDHTEVTRLHFVPPPAASLGTPFEVPVDATQDDVDDIIISQSVDRPMVRHAEDVHAEITTLPDGKHVIRVTPMLVGPVKISLVGVFHDGGVEAESQTVIVGPPTVAPRQIIGDRAFLANNWANRDVGILAHPGWRNGELDPVAFFESVPDHRVDVQGLARFRVISTDKPPVVVMTPDGRFATLRVGVAKVEVSLAGASSVFQIMVNP